MLRWAPATELKLIQAPHGRAPPASALLWRNKKQDVTRLRREEGRKEKREEKERGRETGRERQRGKSGIKEVKSEEEGGGVSSTHSLQTEGPQ